MIAEVGALIANPDYKRRIRGSDIYEPVTGGTDDEKTQADRDEHFKETIQRIKEKVDSEKIPIDTSNLEGVD